MLAIRLLYRERSVLLATKQKSVYSHKMVAKNAATTTVERIWNQSTDLAPPGRGCLGQSNGLGALMVCGWRLMNRMKILGRELPEPVAVMTSASCGWLSMT